MDNILAKIILHKCSRAFIVKFILQKDLSPLNVDFLFQELRIKELKLPKNLKSEM